MQNVNPSDLTRPEPDQKFGKFEPDPSEPQIIRYVPAPAELDRINEYLGSEIDQAWEDDQPNVTKKLELLRAYKGKPEGKEQILIIPLVKRAVKQNVAWVKHTIMQRKPLVTVSPDSNDDIEVLVDDPTFGSVPIKKTSEEVGQALEYWLEYKLRKKIPFDKIVETAAMEAKRGQTPTWIKVCRNEEYKTVRQPKFGKSGPIAVTFEGKDDIQRLIGEATKIDNVSTYAMLMPADEQDAQSSRWLAENCPETSDVLRRCLYNGTYFLIKKTDWEDFIEHGTDATERTDEQKKGSLEKRSVSAPRDTHDVWEVWFNWTVPMKQTLVSIDGETGDQTTKDIKKYKEYSFVGRFHRGHGRLMSMIRNPYDHGERPYVPVFDGKEPFRHTGESLAEDAMPYQKVYSQLESLEIRSGVIATTPVTFTEPGSVAGDWIMEHDVEPGSVIPRLRPEEVEIKNLGERNLSLLGLIEHIHGSYEQQFQIGDLQLGLDVPGRTPASTVSQILNQGETQASMFLDSFRRDLGDVIKLYVQTEQQYMRYGEVIPFDAETKAMIEAALEPGENAGQGIPVRFPVETIHDQFGFTITASSDDRTQQNEFERLVALKNIIDQDGALLAQIIAPLASGQLPPAITDLLIQDFTRREKVMELIAKSMRKDGKHFAVDPKLLTQMVEQQQIAAQAAQQQAQMAQQGGPNGNTQGVGAGAPRQPPADNTGGLGGPLQQPSVPIPPLGGQTSGGGPPVIKPGY